MLLIVEKIIREVIFNANDRYVKTNVRYMKDYNKKKESFCLRYCLKSY